MEIEQLKEAFHKLLSYTYFDKTDLRLRHAVATFAKRLSKPKEEERIFRELLSIANGEGKDVLESFLEDIELYFLPKKIASGEEQKDAKFVTNIPRGNAITEKLLVKSYFPIELMILDIAWLLKYGYVVDKSLKSESYGNRLDFTQCGDRVQYGSSVFKRYYYQYQKWWRNGIETSNKALKDKSGEEKSISIINLDITNCYHSIDFNFDEFFDDYNRLIGRGSDIRESSLTEVIVQIYEKYWSIVNDSDAQPFQNRNRGKKTMPMSLLSAHLLANWYISPLDNYVLENCKGLRYYGRYVDDCMIVIQSESDKRNVRDFIGEVLPGLVNEDSGDIVFDLTEDLRIPYVSHLSNFTIQEEKLYVYHFDCQFSQGSLEKYEEEQRKRSSEFRFLTDEADEENGNGLELFSLVSSLDAREEKGRRFDMLEENRYKLSVFFAKLNQRLARFGEEYEHIDEVNKVFKYFRNYLLIKHYVLWEKMFTTFVLSNRGKYVKEFRERIADEIQKIDVKDDIFIRDKKAGLDNIRKALLSHLKESVCMAESLKRGKRKIDRKYLDTFMVRAHFNHLPLQEFAVNYAKYGVRLSMKNLHYKKYFKYKWMPYYVKYYDIVCALMIGEEFHPDIYKKAYEIYKTLNQNVDSEEKWKDFMCIGINNDECEFNTSSEISCPNNLTVSVVEMDLDEKSLKEGIPTFGSEISDNDKILLMRSILDKITAVSTTDIFLMPELALPLYELQEFCQYSSKKKMAFIAGMEYVVRKDNVYNYIVTCLPITLFGRNDAVPVIRLKNYYAPKESVEIEGLGKRIPNSKIKWKILYHWKGHVFTNLYCFELTSIKDRAHFQSLIDVMYCPVLNQDTPYFNSIAESCSRDLHCYFIMSNTSRYGDSRVTKPSKSAEMNIMRVKGGNTDANKAIVLSAQLDIAGLREFQKLSLKEQYDYNNKKGDEKEEKQGFKMTPPDFKKEKVEQRAKCRFLLMSKDLCNPGVEEEDFFSNI
jgi:hypothetical protein